MTYQSHSNNTNTQNPTSFCFALETTHLDKAHFINTTIALQYPSRYILRKTSIFHKYFTHKICSQKYIHASSPSKIPACTQSACNLEGQLLGKDWAQAGVCRWGCEEAFGFWVVLELSPASVGLILSPRKTGLSCTLCPIKAASAACVQAAKSHPPPHLLVFQQLLEMLRFSLALDRGWKTRALEAGRSLPGFGRRGSVNGLDLLSWLDHASIVAVPVCNRNGFATALTVGPFLTKEINLGKHKYTKYTKTSTRES